MTTSTHPLTGARRGRRSGRAKSDILEAASLVVAERGADATRFADVSRATGVPVSTLQYYFGNREDLLLAIFRHVCEREAAAMIEAVRSSDDPWRQLVELVRVGVADGERTTETWRSWVELWRAGLRDDEVREEVHAIYRAWRELIHDVVVTGVAGGRFAGATDARAVSFQLLALIDGIGVPAALADPGLALDAVASVDLVVDALARLLGVAFDATVAP